MTITILKKKGQPLTMHTTAIAATRGYCVYAGTLVSIKIEKTIKQATKYQRIGAFIIDHVIMTFTIVILCFLVIGDFSSEDFNNLRFILFPIVIIIGMVAYIGKDAIDGRSLGKRVLGIMVRDSSDHSQIPSIERLFQRNLTLAFWPFEYFELSNLPEKQRKGDRIAQTVVLQNPVRPKKTNYVLIGIGLFVSIITGIFFLVSSMFLNSEPYKISINEIENSEELKSELGTITGYGFMPTGSINITNGVGEANLCISVKGSMRNKIVCTELSKAKNGKWILNKME